MVKRVLESQCGWELGDFGLGQSSLITSPAAQDIQKLGAGVILIYLNISMLKRVDRINSLSLYAGPRIEKLSQGFILS